MNIKDVMTKNVITVNEVDRVEICANLLSRYPVSGLPVLNEAGNVVGIVTEGDLIGRAAKIEGPAFLEILGGIIYLDNPKTFLDEVKKSMGYFASDVMTKNVITIGPNASLEEAALLLVKHKVKRLPVMNQMEELVGIVSRKDIMTHLFSDE